MMNILTRNVDDETKYFCVLCVFQTPVLPNANMHKKTPLEILFIYLCNKIYCILQTRVSVLFDTKCHLFH